ncbi:MAG: DHH family phosphoesterase [Ruminococcus sp.]|nr:DHH family phosphoesterase [Ruminococcus sp.]
MKNKSKLILPYLALFCVVMLLSAVASLFYSKTIFAVQSTIAFAGILVTLVIYLRYNHCVRTIIHSVLATTKGVNKKYLDRFGFPVAVVNKENEFIWYNDAFSREFCDESGMYGVSTTNLIKGRSLAELCGSKGGDISVGKKKFSVYANPIDQGFLLYFFDDTYYKDVEQEYNDSRQSVALVVLDNRDAFEDEDEDDYARVAMEVESILQKWATEYNALYRKWGSSRYMLIFEERYIRKLIDTKFDILSKVREIKLDDVGATISIGIGRGEPDLRKSQSAAKRALDMALGRGGDQVAIFKDGDFEFFGGKSSGGERQSKVRIRVISKSLMTAVEESDKVIIMGHKFSDLDSVGSAIGLCGAITRGMNKKTCIAVDYDTSMAKGLIDTYKQVCGDGVFVNPRELVHHVTPDTLLIIVDTQSESRLESADLYKACSRVIVIDHHRMSVDHLQNTLVFYHEPSASSASEMCVEVIDTLFDDILNKSEAEALLSGIILDTKNFVVNSGFRTFEAAAYLRRHGADTVNVRTLFADSIELYRNKYELVSTARIYKKCAIVIADKELPDIRLIASKAADELLGLKGVNASFVVFRTDQRTVNISARSYGKRNVQIVMEKLGGGGHHAMAAAQLRDETVENAVRQLLSAIDSE